MNQAEQLNQFLELSKSRQVKIGDLTYSFGDMSFREARKVFAYLTIINNEIESGMVGFIDTDKFLNEIEPLLIKYSLVDGFKLSSEEDHFAKNPSHYIQFVTTSIQVFASPFMPAQNTSLQSTQTESQVTTFKKPM